MTTTVTKVSSMDEDDMGDATTRCNTVQQQQSQQESFSSSSMSLGLIDVDCNLWHSDFQDLVASVTAAPPPTRVDDATAASVSSASASASSLFRILQQDNLFHIRAMVSPSSTLQEAVRGVAALRHHRRCILHSNDNTDNNSVVIDQPMSHTTCAAATSTNHTTTRQSLSNDTNTNTKSNTNTIMRLFVPRILTTVGVHPYHVNDLDTDEEAATAAASTDKNGTAAGSSSSNNNNNSSSVDDVARRIQRQMQVARDLLVPSDTTDTDATDTTSHHSSSSFSETRLCGAIGECGLDASPGFPPLTDQRPWFIAQLQLAAQLQSHSLFVHERLAFQETLTLLKQYIVHDEMDTTTLPSSFHHQHQSSSNVVWARYRPQVPILIHCFTGTVSDCRTYLEHGYSISISGYVFRPSAQPVRQCLIDGMIPLDKLMIETDAPYMGFPHCRDLFLAHNAPYIQTLKAKERKRLLSSQRPNPPSALTAVFDQILSCLNQGRELRGEPLVSPRELAVCTSRNANAFFGFGFSDQELLL